MSAIQWMISTGAEMGI